MYDGGTTLDDTANAIHAKATISMQEFCTEKTLALVAEQRPGSRRAEPSGGRHRHRRLPDEVSRITGKPIPAALHQGTRPPGRRDGRLQRPHPRQEVRDLRRSGLRLGMVAVPARTRRRADHCLATNGNKDWEDKMQALFACLAVRQGLQGLGRQGSLAPALAAVHRAGRLPDRHDLRQVSRARHRHPADPPGLPDLRSPPPPPLSGLGLSGWPQRAGEDPRQDLRRAGQERRRWRQRHLLRPHSLKRTITAPSNGTCHEQPDRQDSRGLQRARLLRPTPARPTKERKKGCTKPLQPGGAAGGCAFDGAKIALQPITDVAHLVHGPIACEGNSLGQSRRRSRPARSCTAPASPPT